MHGILSIIKFYCAWKIDWKIKTVTGYDETIYNEFKTFQVRCTKNLWQQHQSKNEQPISIFSHLFSKTPQMIQTKNKKQKTNNKTTNCYKQTKQKTPTQRKQQQTT